jgi:hypothetical protein
MMVEYGVRPAGLAAHQSYATSTPLPNAFLDEVGMHEGDRTGAPGPMRSRACARADAAAIEIQHDQRVMRGAKPGGATVATGTDSYRRLREPPPVVDRIAVGRVVISSRAGHRHVHHHAQAAVLPQPFPGGDRCRRGSRRLARERQHTAGPDLA